MEYTIGEFSHLSGISIYTLRYYEKENLIVPARRENDRRYYTDADLTWAAFIKRLKSTGMPIKQISTYATLRSQGDSTLEPRMDMLTQHRQALSEQIAAMSEHLSKLDEKIDFYKKEITENQHNKK